MLPLITAGIFVFCTLALSHRLMNTVHVGCYRIIYACGMQAYRVMSLFTISNRIESNTQGQGMLLH